MAITTYAELKTAVANWAHRSDLTSVIPDFIVLAESAIRRDVRVQVMEQTATGTLSATTLATPTRYLEPIRVVLNNREQRYVPPVQFEALESATTDMFTVVGTNFVFQSASADYDIVYYQSFAAFSGSSDTNWLLTNHPGVYLFAALSELTSYVSGNPAQWMAKYKAEVAAVMAADQRARFGPRLVVRPDVSLGGGNP